MNVDIRPAIRDDRESWLRMRCALWPGRRADHERDVDAYFARTLHEPIEVLLALEAARAPVGFVGLNIGNYAEGCDTDRVGYLEGWFVAPEARRQGVGRAISSAAPAARPARARR